MAKIYFAGPLFTWGEREQNRLIVEELRKLGHEVFLPQETEQQAATANAIFKSDINGLTWAEVITGCMDGADPDSGTCFEVGFAMRSIPIVLFRTDIREERPPLGPYNLMLHQAAAKVLNLQWMGPSDIADSLHLAIKEAIAHDSYWRCGQEVRAVNLTSWAT